MKMGHSPADPMGGKGVSSEMLVLHGVACALKRCSSRDAEVSHGDFFETGRVRRAVVVPRVALCRWLQAGIPAKQSIANRRARVATSICDSAGFATSYADCHHWTDVHALSHPVAPGFHAFTPTDAVAYP
jgi:hypothetical protein